ncbi:MAG: elongation factor G [Rhodospirillales bacterium]|nr:elongation factor G [Rhodospirillales bacterium]MDH3917214.1 elongation factor G [Rhodospirillales bacterium]MDH3967629.1 elongation factor G [Rhodospirillales bacterium]
MTTKTVSPPRCAVLVGPYTSGKTTLLEAMLHTAGAIHRKGSIAEGNTVGDSTPEARARQMGVEPNFAHAEYLGEAWSFIDCPGSVELSQESRNALMAADVAVVVAEPEPERALTLAPIFRFLEDYKIPHMLFVNKMEKSNARIKVLLEALQAVSPSPLVLRQVPIRDGEDVTGFVDLVSERAYRYQEGKSSDLIEMPEAVRDREGEARQEMLESLADFDDNLLEQLLEDKVPAPDEVYGQLTEDLRKDLIVPVFLGSAEHMFGITRLLKALRHEGPDPATTAERLGIPIGGALTATVVKTLHQSHTGRLSIARIWHGKIEDGMTLAGERLSGLYHVMGGENQKLSKAGAGDLVALGRLEELQTGDLITAEGRSAGADMLWPEVKSPVFSLAVAPKNRQDEVKLTTSIAKLIEEDASISLEHNQSTHQMLLWGQGEMHLKLAVERLKSKYNVDVEMAPPLTAYKETIRKGTTQHSRFKRQTGGHGQFGDVQVEINPQPRGQGFEFINKVVGGSIPRNYIPAVEHGVKDYLESGPLGFPVVDVSVTLFDGQYHSVDSSDMAFKTAGRLAMQEGLPNCQPVLLEPIYEVTISVPTDFTNKIHSLVSGRRGQILGFEPKPGWTGWDDLKCYLPQSEIHDLVIELRSLTLGVGSFAWKYDHLQELTGKLADKVIADRKGAD